jgi:tetratricopeptide (TPR) repeat protein
MQLHGMRFQPTADPPRLTARKTAAYGAAILFFLGLLYLLNVGIIRSPFAPPPTPTRSMGSYADEGKAFFDAGILDKAIAAYRNAAGVDPKNPALWAELARIQTYSSSLMLSTDQKTIRMQEARESVETSVTLDEDYATGWAIKTLVLDWSASQEGDEETRQEMLNNALQASSQALLLEPSNPLALAFRAEVLADQENWSSALDLGARAADLGPEIMDVRRAYAYVLESNGYYSLAIEEYLAAITLNTNLPFLYMSLGANYRRIGETATSTVLRDEMIDNALEAFQRAAELNPKDPLPYLSIARTYSNQGEFFAAERNAQKALELDNTNAFIYGRLGVIYYFAKNYESALLVLRCAVRGCTAEQNEEADVDVIPIALSAGTVDMFYIYGSVLAFYGQEDPENCAEAARIFAQLRASPYYDDTIEGIIREGEVICASFNRPSEGS